MPCFLKCLENCIFRLPAIRFLFNFYEFPLINFSESRAGCRVEIDSSQNCIETKIFAGPLRSAFWVLKLPPYVVEPFVSCTRYCQTPVDFSVFYCHLDVDIRILKSRDSTWQSDGYFVLLLRIECSFEFTDREYAKLVLAYNPRPVVTQMFRIFEHKVFHYEQLCQHWYQCEVPPSRWKFKRLCKPLWDEFVYICRGSLLCEFSAVLATIL